MGRAAVHMSAATAYVDGAAKVGRAATAVSSAASMAAASMAAASAVAAATSMTSAMLCPGRTRGKRQSRNRQS
jgi:hypothetical protein